MTQPPPPGWYPDPQGSPQQRWWDGSAWTETTSGPPATYAAPSGPWAGGPSMTPAVRRSPMAMGPQRRADYARSADKTALAAMGIAAAYVALAVFAHFWLIGFLPIILSVRSMRMGSRLGVVALVVSIAAAVGGFVIATHPHG